MIRLKSSAPLRILAGLACLLSLTAARQAPASASIRITSPLGRTGVVAKVRIVAQVDVPAGQTLSIVSFYVDGKLVGTAAPSHYSTVEWVDENPFEKREIVAQAADSAGHVIRDVVVLPAFAITDFTEVTSILLEAGISDKTGRFISDLASSAFAVSDNGVPQKIDMVARETMPTTLVLLVDNSQSMSRNMEFVRLAAERLAGALRARDQVIVAPFNAHIGTITGPTNDGPTIAQAISAMQAAGGTAFLDGLRESTKLLEGFDGRRAVILITDGYDENSTMPIDEVISAAQTAQSTVYVVGIGGVAGISLKGERMLRRIADETGGRIFFPPREPDLVSIADQVATDAHSRYLITYTPVNQRQDRTCRPVAVDVPTGIASARAGSIRAESAADSPVAGIHGDRRGSRLRGHHRGRSEVFEDGVPQNSMPFRRPWTLCRSCSISIRAEHEEGGERRRRGARLVAPFAPKTSWPHHRLPTPRCSRTRSRPTGSGPLTPSISTTRSAGRRCTTPCGTR